MQQKKNALITYLLESISLGYLNPGDKIPSRNRLAEKYALSYDTVDKSLKALTEAGVLTAIQGRGTFVAQPHPPSERISRIYAVFHSQGYFNKNLEMLLPGGTENDVSIINVRDREAELYLPQFLKPGSGVVWYYPFPKRIGLIDLLHKAGVPTLLLNRDYDGFHCVMTDPKESLRDGITWLRSAGENKEIALIYAPPGTAAPYRAKRIIATYELMSEMGIPLKKENVFALPNSLYLQETPTVAKKIFGRKKIPGGLILLDMEMALLLVSQGLSFGKIPGRDYRLLMFDTEPQLTEYHGIGMMNQMLQEFCDETMRFFFSREKHNGLFRKYIKARLWINTAGS